MHTMELYTLRIDGFFFGFAACTKVTVTVKGKGMGQRVLSTHCVGHSKLGAHYKYHS